MSYLFSRPCEGVKKPSLEFSPCKWTTGAPSFALFAKGGIPRISIPTVAYPTLYKERNGWGTRRTQTPSATNRGSVIPQEKPWPPSQPGLWQSGKRPLLSSFSIDQFRVSHSIISLTALLLLPINAIFDLLHLYLESAHPPIRGASWRAKHQPRLNRELVSSQSFTGVADPRGMKRVLLQVRRNRRSLALPRISC